MTADTVGGVWSYALELIAALKRYDVEVALATMGVPLSEDQRAAAAAVSNLDLFESRFRLEWMDEPWDDVRRASEWLLALEAMLDPDLVHLNGYSHGALDWKAPTVVVGHSCVLSWWEAVKNEPAPVVWDRYRREVAQGLSRADAVVAPSRAMLEALSRHYGGAWAGRVIPNGRNPASYKPAAKEEIILAAGRLWDPAKNVGLLDRIAPRLGWPVFLAGERQNPDGGAPLRGRSQFLGRLSSEALARWLGRAAIYAHPARYEPFGLSVLEAALSGCALVLGDIPSLREIWGRDAVYVDPEDPDALHVGVEGLILDRGRRADLARRALTRARAFTPERMAAGYYQLYEELLMVRRTAAGEGPACVS